MKIFFDKFKKSVSIFEFYMTFQSLREKHFQNVNFQDFLLGVYTAPTSRQFLPNHMNI